MATFATYDHYNFKNQRGVLKTLCIPRVCTETIKSYTNSARNLTIIISMLLLSVASAATGNRTRHCAVNLRNVAVQGGCAARLRAMWLRSDVCDEVLTICMRNSAKSA